MAAAVVRGDQHVEGESVTASDLYAPVLNATESRLILAIAAAEGCSVYKTDTSQAFLYGSMGDDVEYIKAPDWWPASAGRCVHSRARSARALPGVLMAKGVLSILKIFRSAHFF